MTDTDSAGAGTRAEDGSIRRDSPPKRPSPTPPPLPPRLARPSPLPRARPSGDQATMHIQELILDGFKSYPVRTQITGWDPSFNAITGLNGSGKSNILDAICFVLGLTNLTSVSGIVFPGV